MIAGQLTRQAVAAAGDRVLLIRPDGHEATGQEVEARTTGLALALGKQGLAGQRIGLWSWNSAAMIEAHLATEWAGATRVPVDRAPRQGNGHDHPCTAVRPGQPHRADSQYNELFTMHGTIMLLLFAT